MQNRPARLGCLTPGAIVTAVAVVVIVAGLILFTGGDLFNPGPLSAQAAFKTDVGVGSHAEITGCAQCHPAFWSGEVMSDRCLVCHTNVRQDAKNFHRVMFSKTGSSTCRSCHTEHNGANASLTLAMDLQNFPHDLLSFSLQAHAKDAGGSPFQCAGCHERGYAGAFDQALCSSCHSNLDASFMTAHIQTFGSNCLACHDGVDTYGRAFDHTQVPFSLTGKHQSVDCIQCHPSAHVLAELKSAPQACSACHAKDDAHQGSLGQDCGSCHTPDSWQQASIDHNQTAFPLFGKHQTVVCVGCHVNNVFKGTPVDCFSCHSKDDAHKGAYGADCSLCHTPDGWLPASFNHALTIFPLTGAHASLACSRCHAGGPNGIVFKGTPTVCSACHADPAYHAGLFGLDCTSCHNTSGWTPAQFNRSHNFDLNHEGANTCRDCHPTNLNTYTCVKCHPGGVPAGDSGGGN